MLIFIILFVDLFQESQIENPSPKTNIKNKMLFEQQPFESFCSTPWKNVNRFPTYLLE